MASVPEEDCCRVCRSEGTPEDPLFYPCKCSGSIRYVHQDCLLEWLSHSNKKHCELCKTPFRFTSLYDPAMPRRLPIRQVWHKLVADIQSVVRLALRWLLVTFVWLGWLPYCTRHIWRSTIRVGDQLTANSSEHLHELANMTAPYASNEMLTVETLGLTLNETTVVLTDTFLPVNLSNLTTSPMVNKILIEIFEGQVITSVIIIVFVMIFLIREWIVQNNANLLDETPEFLQQQQQQQQQMPARDEARRLVMRLEAAPPQAAGRDPIPDILTSETSDDELAQNPPASSNSSSVVRHNGESSIDIPPRSNGTDLSDWEMLKFEAARTARSRQGSALPLSGNNSEVTADNGQEATDDALVSMAELKAIRREAILRATARRLQDSSEHRPHDHQATSSSPEIGGSELPASVRRLEARLAQEEGDATAQGSWQRHARQRSTERKIWENIDVVSGIEYPDSPVPAPRPDRYLIDSLQLPAAAQPLLPRMRESHEQDNRETMADMTREIEIAATTRNPSLRPSPEVEKNDPIAGASKQINQGKQVTATMTDDALEVLLDRIRQAPTARIRTETANAAIDVCVRVARSIIPTGTLNKTDTVYRETIRQVGKIAMTASQHGTDGIIDVQKAFQLADDRSVTEPIETSADAVPGGDEDRENVAADVPMFEGAQDVADVQRDAELEAELAREELMLDDDIDGLLDLIGVRGPIVALLQNSMLVVVMVTSFIFFGICLPYMFGKCVISVAENPNFYLVRMPIEIARIITSQFIGSINIISSLLGALFKKASQRSIFVESSLRFLPSVHAYTLWDFVRTAYSKTHVTLHFDPMQLHGLPTWIAKSNFTAISTHVPDIDLNSSIRDSGIELPARLTTVLSGYIGLTLISALYVKTNQRLTTGEQGKQIEIAVRSFLRQAGFVMKFVVILGIELVIFPFYCGLLLDAVLSPFLPHSTLVDRLSFFVYFPFTSLFLHWLVGTVYMFNFALFVSMCREIVRPGLLFFIRDPNDPTFNPIKDILERSIRSQLRKIGISLVIYGGLIVVALGAVIKAITYSIRGLLPLHLTPNQPLFEVPFDLLMFQILLPLTFRYAEPHKKIKTLWEYWFKYTSHLMRLSSFIMGERRSEEEGYIPTTLTDFSRKLDFPDTADASFVRDGTFRRVPATDSLPMRVGKEMIMLVTEGNELVTKTDEEDETRDDSNYTVVYAPPQLQLRIYVFLFLLWAFAAVICVAASVVPLIVGRKLSRKLSSGAPVHDLFAYMYGVYLIGALLLLAVKAKHALAGVERATTYCRDCFIKPEEATTKLRSGAELVLRWLYLVSTLSVVIPILLGLSLETYFIIPLGIWLNPAYTPTIHIVHDWVVGLVYVKIIGRTALMMPTNNIGQALNDTMHNDWRRGWRNPDLRVATKHLILPVTAILLAALVIPLSVAGIARWTVYYEAPIETGTLLYRMSYPATLITGLLILSAHYAALLVHRWRGTVRDALYLRGRQLHNFGEPQPPTAKDDLLDTTQQINQGDSTSQDASEVLEELLQNVEATSA